MLERICPFLTTYSPLCDILEGIGPFYEEKWNIFQTFHATHLPTYRKRAYLRLILKNIVFVLRL